MTSTYDSTGITLDRYADIRARLVALAKSQWGESVDTEEDGILGHLFSNISLIQGESNEVLQSVYDGLSVSSATGAPLDSLLELLFPDGRLRAAYSTVTLTLTASGATTVPVGSRYGTAAGVVFTTDEELVFSGSGTDTVEATCTVTGEYNAAATEVNEILTTVYLITTCSNVAAAIPGRDRETSAEYKIRHTAAVATAGAHSVAAIHEAVSAVTGVSGVLVTENDTNVTVDSIPSHSVHVVVIGGADADIAEAIANNLYQGVGTYGSDSEVVTDATTGNTRTIYFDRATPQTIHVAVTVTTETGVFPDDGEAQIRTNLLAHIAALDIGDDVTFSALYRPIYDVAGLVVDTLEIGTSDPPGLTTDISISATQVASLVTGDIDVTIS
ncbi:MAG: hypothetical protein GY832_17955 [Chloroflexi bacterium]|nr:hypothetical protein [Chloroflexota bacterium]